jgi:hypothetical protein
MIRREFGARAAARDRTDRIDVRRARRTTSETIGGESSAGSVFGMHATAVKPPATAAAAPVAMVSLCV